MKAKGSSYLKVTGVLEILFGAVSIAMTLWILSQDPADFNVYGFDVKETLWTLVLIYGTAAVQIISGLIGITFSNKLQKATLCQAFGIILIVMQISYFGRHDGGAQNVIANILGLVVPCFYYFGAVLNKRQSGEELHAK